MNRLRLAREAFGYTSDRLADELGIHFQTIKSWEDGAVMPTLPELRDLAVLYGTSVNDLSGDDTLVDRSVRSIYMTGGEGIDGFWGHVGVFLPESRACRWYPICVGPCAVSGAVKRTNLGRKRRP